MNKPEREDFIPYTVIPCNLLSYRKVNHQSFMDCKSENPDCESPLDGAVIKFAPHHDLSDIAIMLSPKDLKILYNMIKRHLKNLDS